jgi:hypothetical protein
VDNLFNSMLAPNQPVSRRPSAIRTEPAPNSSAITSDNLSTGFADRLLNAGYKLFHDLQKAHGEAVGNM